MSADTLTLSSRSFYERTKGKLAASVVFGKRIILQWLLLDCMLHSSVNWINDCAWLQLFQRRALFSLLGCVLSMVDWASPMTLILKWMVFQVTARTLLMLSLKDMVLLLSLIFWRAFFYWWLPSISLLFLLGNYTTMMMSCEWSVFPPPSYILDLLLCLQTWALHCCEQLILIIHPCIILVNTWCMHVQI